MSDYKAILNQFKDNIILFLLLIYATSFINYYIFYDSFNIPIFNYVELKDLIFFPLVYIIKVLIIIIAIEFSANFIFVFCWNIYEVIVLKRKKKIGLYIKSNKTDKTRILEVIGKPYNSYLNGGRVIIVLIGVFILSNFPYKLLTCPAIFLYFIYALKLAEKEISITFILVAVCIIFLFTIIASTMNDSYNKRFYKTEYCISFVENGETVTTEKGLSSLNYLGETSSTIFLYDINSKKAKVYQKSLVTNVEIQNTNTLDNWILNIKKFALVRAYIEMSNRD